MNMSIKELDFEDLQIAAEYNDRALIFMLDACHWLMPNNRMFAHELIDDIHSYANELLNTQEQIKTRMKELIDERLKDD